MTDHTPEELEAAAALEHKLGALAVGTKVLLVDGAKLGSVGVVANTAKNAPLTADGTFVEVRLGPGHYVVVPDGHVRPFGESDVEPG